MAVTFDIGLSRRADGGKRHHLDTRAAHTDRLDCPVHQAAGQGFQPVVALMMQVVGLGGGNQHAIDAAADQ